MTNDSNEVSALSNHPQRLHYVLGTIAFFTFLILIVVDSADLISGFEVSDYQAGLLVLSYLVFLGFGVIVSQILGRA